MLLTRFVTRFQQVINFNIIKFLFATNLCQLHSLYRRMCQRAFVVKVLPQPLSQQAEEDQEKPHSRGRDSNCRQG